ncbi:hypothetical protein TrCOL_g13570 [Triparma columacea]|uniref:Bifunctional dihydrofolate reductase-thymidylate synthase n=1 Tax=Triparma columacea TaxID=722753 RepID=A0A9W7L233_9STRA|nr:hypothetical protein TrCOL_g13570 [Triparma columacea]
MVSVIVAASKAEWGIGCKNELPWRISEDMKHFKNITETAEGDKVNAVIMGRKTWESIPSKFRPLPSRINVVLSRSFLSDQENATTAANEDGNVGGEYPEDVIKAGSLEDALEKLKAVPNLSRTFIIGGGEIYNLAMSSNLVSSIYLTQVSSVPPSTKFDAFFPKLATSDWEVEDIGGGVKTDKKGVLKYQFFKYSKPEEGEDVNPEEMQ